MFLRRWCTLKRIYKHGHLKEPYDEMNLQGISEYRVGEERIRDRVMNNKWLKNSITIILRSTVLDDER